MGKLDIISIGDLHSGSTKALVPERYIRNDMQRFLFARWQNTIEYIKSNYWRKNKPYALEIGGDMIEGHHHHQKQVWGNTKEQRDCAIELLQPIANRAKFVISVTGTEAHVNDDGEDDKQVAQELGAKRSEYLELVGTEGKTVLFSHHGASVGKNEWNESDGLYRLTKVLARFKPKVDYAVFHHTHVVPDKPVTANGVQVAVCPCWKWQDAHGAKAGALSLPSIGFIVIRPQTGIEVIKYELPQRKILRID